MPVVTAPVPSQDASEVRSVVPASEIAPFYVAPRGVVALPPADVPSSEDGQPASTPGDTEGGAQGEAQWAGWTPNNGNPPAPSSGGAPAAAEGH